MPQAKMNPPLFEVTERLAQDVGLGDLGDGESGLHSDLRALALDAILQCERVDDGGEHSHVIGGGAVHLAVRLSASPEVASAYHHAHLSAHILDLDDLFGHFGELCMVDAAPVRAGESFAGQFDDYSFVLDLSHDFLFVRSPADGRGYVRV